MVRQARPGGLDRKKNGYTTQQILKRQERSKTVTTGKAIDGKPYAGNPHVRFGEGEVASPNAWRRLWSEVMANSFTCNKESRSCR